MVLEIKCWEFWWEKLKVLLIVKILTIVYIYSSEVSEVLSLNGADNATYYPDKFADKEIGQFKVFCSNKSNGCTWTGRLKYLEVSCFWLINFFTVSPLILPFLSKTSDEKH